MSLSGLLPHFKLNGDYVAETIILLYSYSTGAEELRGCSLRRLDLRQRSESCEREMTGFFENSVLMFDVRTRCVSAELTHGGKIYTVCCLDGLHTSPERERNKEASSTH